MSKKNSSEHLTRLLGNYEYVFFSSNGNNNNNGLEGKEGPVSLNYIKIYTTVQEILSIHIF